MTLTYDFLTRLDIFIVFLFNMHYFMLLETTVTYKCFNHIDHISGVFLQDMFFYDTGDYSVFESVYHIDHIHKVSLQYVSFIYLETTVICRRFVTLTAFL